MAVTGCGFDCKKRLSVVLAYGLTVDSRQWTVDSGASGARLSPRTPDVTPSTVNFSLVDKAEGFHEKIRRMMSQLNAECIFIYGSEADGTAKANSDIDIFVIGSCTFLDISEALLSASDISNREINPFLITPKTFKDKCASNDHFIQNVLRSPMIFLKGGKNELERLAGKRLA